MLFAHCVFVTEKYLNTGATLDYRGANFCEHFAEILSAFKHKTENSFPQSHLTQRDFTTVFIKFREENIERYGRNLFVFDMKFENNFFCPTFESKN